MNNTDIPILKVRLLELRTHIHATEDVLRVQTAFFNMIGLDHEEITEKEFHVDQLRGSFSNPIRVFSLKFTNKVKIKNVLHSLSQNMDINDKYLLNSQLESRLSEKLKFFFRVEKQEIFNHKIVLANSKDVIQIVIAIQNKTPYTQVNLENIRTFLHDLEVFEKM